MPEFDKDGWRIDKEKETDRRGARSAFDDGIEDCYYDECSGRWREPYEVFKRCGELEERYHHP